VHTTPEQCLMSITAIARQAQGMRAGEVIAKLAEDAYFMRVDNRVAQPPPVRNRDNEATSRSADLGRNRTRAELPANPNHTRATAGGPSQGGNSAATASGVVWTSLGPLPRWVPGPTTRWALGTTRLALHGT
jgi:hypothetical protein